MRIILMGPPGAGKGTQATAISRHLGIPHISTGAIFREQMSLGTELGLTAARFINQGDYVPDSVTNPMVASRLEREDCASGFLLDGYPRTLDQIEALDRMLAEHGEAIEAVIKISVDGESLVQRLLKRAQAEGRADDNDGVIRRRMQVYAEQTAPITDVYRGRGLLHQVDGSGSVEEVFSRILAALEV